MKVAWFQYDIKWLDSKFNLDNISTQIEESEEKYDLLVLPEMFDTGFALNPQEIKNRDQEEVLTYMKNLASKKKIALIFSMAWKTDGTYKNRLFHILDNKVNHYDKVHLFSPGGESEFFTEGKNRNVMESVNGIKVLPLICYDLRFPEISRNTKNIDLIIYCASWPESRTSHWDALLKARAIENQCYVLGVNRLGHDGNNLNYIGHSSLYDYAGEIVIPFNTSYNVRKEKLFIATIDTVKQDQYRKKLPFLNDIKT